MKNPDNIQLARGIDELYNMTCSGPSGRKRRNILRKMHAFLVDTPLLVVSLNYGYFANLEVNK